MTSKTITESARHKQPKRRPARATRWRELNLRARADGRDVRAKRQSLVSIIFDRHLLMRFFNGVVLAAMDLVLLFASLLIALRVKTALIDRPDDARRIGRLRRRGCCRSRRW